MHHNRSSEFEHSKHESAPIAAWRFAHSRMCNRIRTRQSIR
ncbi:hypothetical protein K788_0000414 [Paraburkholderia caribensis MBA4]|uniref:Uncharacterized protein n=1 Tax=Paraburkholderia caribensis MBA4 TaxID=1323664 RepID=A0A0P0RIM5_9BURK|nr:hypothetical protein K788_0000414 [Paraburkholderia caribensis MBA4]